ncbi:MAG: AAA family ATPase, partial [Clostridiales bacterium]
MTNYFYPFSAIVGQDTAKNALIYNLINPRIGGVLLSGQKGTAKSTLVRSIQELTDEQQIIELPLNITEDMLIGTIDIQNAIQYGAKTLLPGILAKANNNILYVDEV